MIKTLLLTLMGYQMYPICEVTQKNNPRFQAEDITNVWIRATKTSVSIKSESLNFYMKVDSSYDNSVFFGTTKDDEACSLVYCSDSLVLLTLNKTDVIIFKYTLRK